MISYKDYYSSHSLDDALREIDIPEDKIINIQAKESHKECEGYDEYDTWISHDYNVRVFYKC